MTAFRIRKDTSGCTSGLFAYFASQNPIPARREDGALREIKRSIVHEGRAD